MKIVDDGKKQLIGKEGGFLSLPGYSSAYFISYLPSLLMSKHIWKWGAFRKQQIDPCFNHLSVYMAAEVIMCPGMGT